MLSLTTGTSKNYVRIELVEGDLVVFVCSFACLRYFGVVEEKNIWERFGEREKMMLISQILAGDHVLLTCVVVQTELSLYPKC